MDKKEPIFLEPDQAAWLPVAQKIIDGGFDGADGSTCESLMMGLEVINHPLCRSAMERIQNIKKRKGKR